MANFKANNYGMTGPEAELIARIKAGTTETQRSQAFMDKLLMGGGQAIIGLAGHVGEGLDAADKERRAEAKRKVVGTKPSNLPDWLQATADPETAAELAASSLKVNEAAAKATIGGHSTTDGAASVANNAASMSRDQDTGKALMSESANPYGVNSTWGVPAQGAPAQAAQTWGDGARGMMGTVGPDDEDYDYYAGQDKG